MTPDETFLDRLRRLLGEERVRRRRRARQALLEGLRLEHAATRNPLAVWYAWRMCRDPELPMPPPDWVLAYLDGFAATLRTWVEEKSPSKNLARDVGAALGFAPGKKGDNPLADWRSRREGERWFAAFEKHLAEGLSPSAAIL